MLAGHYATALVAKQKAPAGSLLYYLIASQLPDLLWLVFHYLGLEPTRPADVLDVSLDRLDVDMVYSHDLIPILGWVVVVAAVGMLLFQDRRVAAAGAVLLIVHALTDYLAGYPHAVMGPDTPSVGTGLYHSATYTAIAFEGVYSAGFLVWFFVNDARAGVHRKPVHRATLVGVFVFGLVFLLSVARVSYRELFHIPPLDIGIETTIPAMLITYGSLIAVLMWAMRTPPPSTSES